MKKKSTIKDLWESDNLNCWKIQRKGMVDFYLYLPTMKYIYKSSVTDRAWKGTKNPHPAISMSETERRKIKTFNCQIDAVSWLTK